MGAVVVGGDDLAGNHGVGVLPDVAQAVLAADLSPVGGELIRIPAGAEAELLEHAEGDLLRQHGHVEHAGAEDHVVGVVLLVHGDLDALGVVGEQGGGVDDAAVVLFPFPGGQHIQAVAELKEGVGVHAAGQGRGGFGLAEGGGDGVRQGAQRLPLGFLHAGTDGDFLPQEGDIFALFQHFPHEAAGGGSPGAVFDESHLPVLDVVGHQVGEEGFHFHENARIIGGGGEHQVGIPEALGQNLVGGGHGHVVEGGFHAALPEMHGQQLGGVLGVAVHAGVGNEDPVLLRGVGGPVEILVNEVADVLPPDEAVEGADRLDGQSGGLTQKGRDLGAVLAHDVAVVAPGLVQIIPVEVHLIGKESAVHVAEGAEGVGGEENAVGGVKGHHDLRPVDHGGFHEGKIVPSGGEHLALLGLYPAALHIEGEELLHHGLGGGVADDLHVRVLLDHLGQGGGVVRLHVVDDHVVQMPPI